MGFSQVVEENGVKTLVPINTPSSVTAQEAKLLATEAKALATAAATKTELAEVKQTADGALQKSGGEMSGEIRFDNETGGVLQDEQAWANPAITFRDSAGGRFAGFQAGQSGTDGIFLRLWARRDGSETPVYIGLRVGGTDVRHAHFQVPSYPDFQDMPLGAAINKNVLTDYAAPLLTANKYFYIDPVNGSDTADLHSGRGESQDKAFKTFDAAVRWAQRYCSSETVGLYLMGDVTCNLDAIDFPNAKLVRVTSLNGPWTITLQKPFMVRSGTIELYKVNFAAPDAIANIFAAVGYYGQAHMIINTVNVTGSVTDAVVKASHDAYAVVNGGFTGTVTGKKYSCLYGGILAGASLIPGTIDGTCDANSKVFG